MGIADQVPVQITIQGAPQSDPVYAVSRVYDGVPQGTAFLAMTMEQSGTNAAVRTARHTIANDGTGTKKSVEITVQPALQIHMDSLASMSAAGFLEGVLTAGE